MTTNYKQLVQYIFARLVFISTHNKKTDTYKKVPLRRDRLSKEKNLRAYQKESSFSNF